jgi:TonB family protein
MKTLLLATLPAVLLSACATTSPSNTAGTATSPLAAYASSDALPKLRNPATIADSGLLGQRVSTYRGGEITASVHLCVAPDGKVSDVKLQRSSGMAAYDRAVVDGASAWTYEPFLASTPRCEDVSVAYVVD